MLYRKLYNSIFQKKISRIQRKIALFKRYAFAVKKNVMSKIDETAKKNALSEIDKLKREIQKLGK